MYDRGSQVLSKGNTGWQSVAHWLATLSVGALRAFQLSSQSSLGTHISSFEIFSLPSFLKVVMESKCGSRKCSKNSKERVSIRNVYRIQDAHTAEAKAELNSVDKTLEGRLISKPFLST